MKSMLGTGVLVSVLTLALTGCDRGPQPTPLAEGSTQQPINSHCPIETGKAVNPKLAYVYQGKVVGFCCASCIDEFKASPQKYLDLAIKDQQETQTAAQSKAAQLKEAAAKAGAEVKESVKQVVTDAKEGVKDAADATKTAVKDAADATKTAVKKAVEGTKEAVQTAVEKAKDAAEPSK